MLTQVGVSTRNFFTELIRSWRELLIFVQPAELSMFGLLVANKTLGIYRTMLNLWWFMVVLIAAGVYESTLHTDPLITLSVYSLFIILISRSTVSQKIPTYIFFSAKTGIALPLIGLYLVISWYPQLMILSPLAMLLSYCVLDAHVAFLDMAQAFWRAIKIFLYHCPFFIIVYLCSWYLVYPVLAYPFLWAAGLYGNSIALMLLLPWYSAMIVYGYTRFMREHMDYYYS